MKFVSDLEELFDPTECAHFLEDVKSASCNAATWFWGLVWIFMWLAAQDAAAAAAAAVQVKLFSHFHTSEIKLGKVKKFCQKI
jgi:hypothetical protein